ncbi:MAG: Yip1 family protein [Haloferacaceae archaeon]
MALRKPLRLPRQFVLSPGEFFREHRFASSAAVGFVVVLVLAVALAVSVVHLGGLLAGSTDATVTMENPERPPGWVCESHGDDPDSALAEGCDEPERIERSAGALLREAANEYVAPVFLFALAVWPVAGTTLFLAARLAGGDGGFLATLGVAAWGAIPELLRLLAGLAGLQYALGGTTFDGPVESFPDQLATALAPVEGPLLLVSLTVLIWQWILLTAGIREIHGVETPAAAAAVGIPLAIWGIVGLA